VREQASPGDGGEPSENEQFELETE